MTYPAKICFILFSCAAASVAAETLYKSVNEKGEITFSDSPPENDDRVQEIQVEPAPTESQLLESMEREKRIEVQADNLGESNAARTQARETKQPQEVQQAVEPLESYNTGNSSSQSPESPQQPAQPLPGNPRPATLPATVPAR